MIRFQIMTSVSYAVIAVVLKFLLADRLGMAGIVWGTVASYGLVALPLYVRYARRHLDRVAATSPVV